MSRYHQPCLFNDIVLFFTKRNGPAHLVRLPYWFGYQWIILTQEYPDWLKWQSVQMKMNNWTVLLLNPWIIAWPRHRHPWYWPYWDKLIFFLWRLLFLYVDTVYPKKYAHGFCIAVLCCGYTLTDFPISIRLTSLALWQSNDCPSASKATLMNMDKYFMWIHYERLHDHNKAKHNKTVCIFLGIYCMIHNANTFFSDIHRIHG